MGRQANRREGGRLPYSVCQGEPMKPLSELVKEWREGWEYNAYADKLEAWLREADKALARGSNSLEANLLGGSIQDRGWSLSCLRSKLLGTTQKPKQEDGK